MSKLRWYRLKGKCLKISGKTTSFIIAGMLGLKYIFQKENISVKNIQQDMK